MENSNRPYILVERIIRVSYVGETTRNKQGILIHEEHIINEQVTSSERTYLNIPEGARTLRHDTQVPPLE